MSPRDEDPGGSKRGVLRVLSGAPAEKASESRHKPKMETRPGTALEFLARAGFMAAALFAYHTGLKLYQGSGVWAPAVPAALLLYIFAAWSLIAAFMVTRPLHVGAQLFVGVLLLVALAGSIWYEVEFGNPTYGTDAIALGHVGGETLLTGQNPYQVVGSSVGDVIDRFGLQDTVVTRTTTGQPIERLISYPGGHVLTLTAGLALGIDDLRWVIVAFEMASLVLIWAMISPVARLFVPFALLMEDNLTVYFTSGSVTDWLWVLPLVAAAFFLHRERFGYAGLAVGVACAMKQQPWFVVPFALVWVYQTLRRRSEARERRDGMTAFLAGTASGFLILNIPFILWSFTDWVQGVLHPALGDLVPDGQGFALLTSRGILPIPSGFYTIALALVGLVVMWVYARWFDRLQDLLWVLPPALFLISQRSFHSYFIFWVPLALLWLDLRLNQPTNAPVSPDTGFRTYTGRSLAIVAVALAVAVGIAAVATASARPIQVGDIAPVVVDGVIQSLTVEITNSSDAEVRPVFEVYWRGQPLPWVAVGDADIDGHDSAVVEVRPSSSEGLPPVQIAADGVVEVADFRVRVNDSGSSVYTASELVHIELDDPVVNPGLGYWTRQNTIFAAPYGWRAAVHGGTDAQRVSSPAERGEGARMEVSSAGAGPSQWVEVALLQDVLSFEACYSWEFDSDLGYTTDGSGSPLAVSGVQLIQGESSIWFVPSGGTDGFETTLSDGTTVVQVHATPEDRSVAQLDVAAHAGSSGIQLGDGGSIKVFNAVHETIAAQSELTTYRLQAGCVSS